MKTEKFSGTVESAYGKVLPSPVKFDGTFEAFETYDEVKTANEIPSNEDIVNIVNAKRKAAARASATTEALQAAGIEKPDPNSAEVISATMVKLLMKQHKVSEEVAKQILAAATQAAGAVA
jgi:hypothetical protein